MQRHKRYRYILENGWFVWMAWATAGHEGLATHLFGGMLLTLLLIELLLIGLAFYWGFGWRMADHLLVNLPVPCGVSWRSTLRSRHGWCGSVTLA